MAIKNRATTKWGLGSIKFGGLFRLRMDSLVAITPIDVDSTSIESKEILDSSQKF